MKTTLKLLNPPNKPTHFVSGKLHIPEGFFRDQVSVFLPTAFAVIWSKFLQSFLFFFFFLPVIISFPDHLYTHGLGLAQAVLFACRLNICCGSSCSLLLPNGSSNFRNSEECIWGCQRQELTRLLALQSQYNCEKTNQRLFCHVDQ